MKLWLTRCNGGRYLLTALRPTISPIRGFRDPDGHQVMDAFEHDGEPIAVRYLCEGGIKTLFGKEFPYLIPVKVELEAHEIAKIVSEEIIQKVVDISGEW
jgi:hypothetical protein